MMKKEGDRRKITPLSSKTGGAQRNNAKTAAFPVVIGEKVNNFRDRCQVCSGGKKAQKTQNLFF
jgi:hypothetical protein